jgi:hypothetical protein
MSMKVWPLPAAQIADYLQKSIAFVSCRVRVFEEPVVAPLVLQDLMTVSIAERLLFSDWQ